MGIERDRLERCGVESDRDDMFLIQERKIDRPSGRRCLV